jgi:prephenate dehydrogenase
MSKPWKQVTVVGCGLIGGSFAMALRAAGQCDRILGWDADANVHQEARARGIIDEVDPAFDREGQSLSDLIYLAMPVRAIVDVFEGYQRVAKRGCLITDSGSTKVEICAAARRYLSPEVGFIGGHPMAGSHLGGLGQARADLFRDATYLLINEASERPNEFIPPLQTTLHAIGARVAVTTAQNHDRAMAFISHLPQLLSSCLAAAVNRQKDHEALERLAGPAYAELTRLASSPWNIWEDIFMTNAANLEQALGCLIEMLQQTRTALQAAKGPAVQTLPEIRSLFESRQGGALATDV